METGMVMDILRGSVHDGPGLRTTVFMKGCTLRCLWCHNPEGLSSKPQLRYDDKRCIRCGKCREACPRDVHETEGGGGHKVSFSRCVCCGKCVEACPAGALSITGRRMATGEVLDLVKKDAAFYQKTGGGLTLSGGEPLMQPEFARELLDGCRKLKIHTAVETAGSVPWENIEATIGLTDLYLFDYKATTEKMQQKYTGGSRKKILDNLNMLCQALVESRAGEIWVRCPIIPGVNDSKEHFGSIKALKAYPGVKKVQLMPYHGLGEHKWGQVGLTYDVEMAGKKAPSKEEARYWESLIE